MPEKKVSKNKYLEEYEKTGMYKGYDIKWLRSEPEHPDFGLVAELDALEGGE